MKHARVLISAALLAVLATTASAQADSFLQTCTGTGTDVPRQDRIAACDAYLAHHAVEVYGPVDIRGRIIARLALGRLQAIGEQFDMAAMSLDEITASL